VLRNEVSDGWEHGDVVLGVCLLLSILPGICVSYPWEENLGLVFDCQVDQPLRGHVRVGIRQQYTQNGWFRLQHESRLSHQRIRHKTPSFQSWLAMDNHLWIEGQNISSAIAKE
jgi:hypothetical protein